MGVSDEWLQLWATLRLRLAIIFKVARLRVALSPHDRVNVEWPFFTNEKRGRSSSSSFLLF